MQNLRLRVMRDSDLPAVVVLNAEAVPDVNALTEQEMAAVRAKCDVALVATDPGGTIIAFLLSLGSGEDYASENYVWFESRGVAHQYIDRIVVSAQAKGTGVGRAMYESVFQRALERGANEITCEVNVMPPNPGSLAFHERMGFRRIGEQDTKGGTVRVALMARPTS